MKNKNLGFLLVMIVLFSFYQIGCEKIAFLSDIFKPKASQTKTEAPVIKGTLLARVDDWVITLEEFNERLKNISELAPEFKVESVDDKKALLDEMIQQQLLVKEAKSRGLDKNKEVIEAVKEFERGILARELITQATQDVSVDSGEIEKYYNQFKEGFKEPAQYRVSEIIVNTEAEANQILIELLRGADFAATARTYSKAPTASKGGDLGFIEQGPFPQFNNVIAALDPGKISNAFKGPNGYYIVKLEDKKGGKQKTLSELWDEIKSGLIMLKQNQILQDLIAKIRQNSKVEIHEEVLR